MRRDAPAAAATAYANRTQRRDAIDALGDETYVVLWRLRRSH